MNELRTAFKYVEDVLTEKIPTSRYVKLACSRFEDLRVNGKEKGIFFDEKKGEKILSYYNYIHHHKAHHAGKCIVLSGWQAFASAYTFGFYKDDEELKIVRRLVKESYIEVAKKNGKTTYSAGSLPYGLMCDGERGAEIYIGGPTMEQASIAFLDCKEFIRHSDYVKVNGLRIMDKAIMYGTNSFIKKITIEGAEGKFSHFVLLDEIHEHPNSSLYDKLLSGMSGRRNPIMFMITTAGFDKSSFCFQKRNALISNLENYGVDGTWSDDSLLSLIYTLDDKDNYEDEDVWIKSNPNMGVSTYQADIRRQIKSIDTDPSQYTAVLTKNLNIWVDAPKQWIKKEWWDKCDYGKIDWYDDSWRGCKCWGGLDLAVMSDLTAYVLIIEKDGKLFIKPKFYIPRSKSDWYVQQRLFNFALWHRSGFLTVSESEVMDYDYVLKDIRHDVEFYNFQYIGSDPYNLVKIDYDLREIVDNGKNGLAWDDEKRCQRSRVEKVAQNNTNLSPPSKELFYLVNQANIYHDGNPVLAWNVRNTSIKEDINQNWRPIKENANSKIDGVLGMIMGLLMYLKFEKKMDVSVYSERGIISV